MKEDWVWNLKELSDNSGVAFLFKQWGTWSATGQRGSKKTNGSMLRGQEYKAYPTPRVKNNMSFGEDV